MNHSLRILNISTSDSKGGAAKAAFRLHCGLQYQGIESLMITQSKVSDSHIIFAPQTRTEKVLSSLQPYFDRLPLRCYRKRKNAPFSPAIAPGNLKAKAKLLRPNIIHLHWVANGFLKIETLQKIPKPLVWTLHDSWAFTGGCHVPYNCQRYQGSCGSCPILASNIQNDLSRWVWQRKHKSWRGLNLTIVTPSQWLADCARASSLFSKCRIQVIPNGLNLNVFKPTQKQIAREILSLPLDKKLILFGAVEATKDPNKGFHLLIQALQQVAHTGGVDDTELLVFGASQPPNLLNWGFKVSYLGYLYDEISLALLYAAADVMVVPSIQEAFCQAAAEAMACGTPVVAFGSTGLLDVVEHEKTGYLAQPYEPEDLAKGITWVLEDEVRHRALSEQARLKAEKNFSIEDTAQRYINLYQELIEIKKDE